MKHPHIIVTAGPTHEPIDPVRYIANRSSGKQGFAIAAALAAKGARVTLIAGPVTLHTPPGVTRINVETAREMASAVNAALPAEPKPVGRRLDVVADNAVDSALPGSTAPPALAAPQANHKLESARAFAQQNPAAVAQIVKEWVGGEPA